MLPNILLSLIALNVILLLALTSIAVFTHTEVNVLMHIAGHILSLSVLSMAYLTIDDTGF
tara:strand:- start:3975 stop:4154 length:180 start_codon:yes stop_codon:yes gene_type:complete